MVWSERFQALKKILATFFQASVIFWSFLFRSVHEDLFNANLIAYQNCTKHKKKIILIRTENSSTDKSFYYTWEHKSGFYTGEIDRVLTPQYVQAKYISENIFFRIFFAGEKISEIRTPRFAQLSEERAHTKHTSIFQRWFVCTIKLQFQVLKKFSSS